MNLLEIAISYRHRLSKRIKAYFWIVTKYKNFKKLLKDANISDIKIFKIRLWHQGSHYFTGSLKDDNLKVFIKTGGKLNLIHREMCVLSYIYERRKADFKWTASRIIGFSCDSTTSYLALEYANAKDLASLMNSNSLSDDDISQIINQFIEISNFLYMYKLVHRDIRPDNILISKENKILKVILIDFAFTVSTSVPEFKELEVVNNIDTLYFLGAGYNPAPLVWDDAYSLYKIAEQLSYNKFDDSLLNLRENIGRYEYRSKLLH